MARTQQVSSDKVFPSGKQRSYDEVIAYLDERWTTAPSLARAQKLNTALSSPSQKVPTILIGGTNGKSLTITFTAHILQAEGLKVGTMSSPHIRFYNERICLNSVSIDNNSFTELANSVINCSEDEGIDAQSLEILTVMALEYFAKKKVDVAILEATHEQAEAVTAICNPRVASLTRITGNDTADYPEKVTRAMAELVKKDTWFVSGDQNKSESD